MLRLVIPLLKSLFTDKASLAMENLALRQQLAVVVPCLISVVCE